MNTIAIRCEQQRQRCPNPHNCVGGCHFNNEVVPMQSAQDRAAAAYWSTEVVDSNPGYDFTLLDAPLNFWDKCNWWQKALTVIAAVIVCGLVGGMAASILTGIPK